MVEQVGPEIDIEENAGGGAVAHISPVTRDTFTVIDRLQDKAWPMKDISDMYSGRSIIDTPLSAALFAVASGHKKTEQPSAVQSAGIPSGRNNYRSTLRKETNCATHANLFANWHLIGSSGWTTETTTQSGDFCGVVFGDLIDQVPGALLIAYNNQNGKSPTFTSYARVKQTIDLTGVKFLKINVVSQAFQATGQSYLKILIGGVPYFVFDYPISSKIVLPLEHLAITGSQEVSIGAYSIGADATNTIWRIDEVQTSTGESDKQMFSVAQSVTITNS